MGTRGEKDLQWPIDSCPPLGVSIRRPSAQKSEFYYLEFHYKPNWNKASSRSDTRMEMKILIWGCSVSFSLYVIQAQTPGVISRSPEYSSLREGGPGERPQPTNLSPQTGLHPSRPPTWKSRPSVDLPFTARIMSPTAMALFSSAGSGKSR